MVSRRDHQFRVFLSKNLAQEFAGLATDFNLALLESGAEAALPGGAIQRGPAATGCRLTLHGFRHGFPRFAEGALLGGQAEQGQKFFRRGIHDLIRTDYLSTASEPLSVRDRLSN